jgi:hypothetical protein
MKVVIASLALSSFIVASAAVARDVKDQLRDDMTFCSQFVIHDPDPAIVLNHVRDCCAYSRNARDCRMYEWGTTER